MELCAGQRLVGSGTERSHCDPGDAARDCSATLQLLADGTVSGMLNHNPIVDSDSKWSSTELRLKVLFNGSVFYEYHLSIEAAAAGTDSPAEAAAAVGGRGEWKLAKESENYYRKADDFNSGTFTLRLTPPERAAGFGFDLDGSAGAGAEGDESDGSGNQACKVVQTKSVFVPCSMCDSDDAKIRWVIYNCLLVLVLGPAGPSILETCRSHIILIIFLLKKF
jgi:hypothetical protein